MATREIPREEWTEFFDGFSRRHEGWLVTVQVLGDAGAQVEAEEQPLVGVSADRGSARAISVMIGGSPEENAVHMIARPARVWVDEEDGAERALKIQSEDGETTLVAFRSAVAPEMVDGMLPERAGERRSSTERADAKPRKGGSDG